MSDGTQEQEKTPFLTTKEAARFLRLKPNTLEKMRVYGGGPQYRKHGRQVFYHRDELKTWSDRRRRDWTADD
ncbi:MULTISPECIES: helix-turn-helix domain-containing protein [Kordiimonas]|jgi:excisionase family DNA binding protein|uniref:helix-turn-helix domain-containing protein n=1 Tax=Kordiimonas TaxID=288021 RepID=UPI00257F7AEF|nr:helix-turn-helix domain-containing protein [Kordiimonas sp. UBA4487]